MVYKIKFTGTGNTEDNDIHFSGPINDYTLCGNTLDSDDGTFGEWEHTTEKVTCEHCITIVKYCKSIRL